VERRASATLQGARNRRRRSHGDRLIVPVKAACQPRPKYLAALSATAYAKSTARPTRCSRMRADSQTSQAR
jgi:hypothetical protein